MRKLLVILNTMLKTNTSSNPQFARKKSPNPPLRDLKMITAAGLCCQALAGQTISALAAHPRNLELLKLAIPSLQFAIPIPL
jgi:hypothetical protein